MVVALMTTVCANAQQMFVKPMVGGTLSTVTKVDDAKMKLGLVGGAEFGYQLNDQFAVTAGLLAAMEGSGMKDGEQTKDVKSTTTYLNVPIHKGSLYEGSKWIDFDESGTDGMKKFDLSIPLGLSYEFSDFVIDARYNLGLTKIAEDMDGKNSVIMLTVGYKISL